MGSRGTRFPEQCSACSLQLRTILRACDSCEMDAQQEAEIVDDDGDNGSGSGDESRPIAS